MNGRRQASQRMDFAIFILRVVLGATFAAHGWQKLFVFGISGVGSAFGSMGVPLPSVVGPVIGVLELLGGIALVFGLFTRIAGLALACDMAAAIALVRWKGGFFAPNGMEFELILFFGAIALAIAGAGAYSIDAMLAGRRADAAVQPTFRSSR